MNTILVSAYAIQPYKGSEDGMGWNFSLQIAKHNKVIAITRENNREWIEKYQSEHPDARYANITFLYFDLPYWMRFWKKGGRGAMLYYYMWQKGIVSFIRKQKLDFDIAHNLNFHNDWTPSFLWKLNKPFVWGPVGHHSFIPSQYLSSWKDKLKDTLTWWVKKYFWNFSVNLRKTRQKAQHIICMNTSAAKELKLRDKFSIIPSVATQDFGWHEEVDFSKEFNIISAGRFVPLKGFDLSIKAFADFFHKLDKTDRSRVKLTLVGSGPMKEQMQRDIKSLGIENHVEIVSWIARTELMDMFKKSALFLFPSHEGAGMVVAEALSFGVPVACLDNDGPGEFITPECGIAVQPQSYQGTVDALSQAIGQLFSQPEKHREMRKAARKRFEDAFDWDNRSEQLHAIYQEVLQKEAVT
jgi:glycosyltransferase involved in cell wall biosynthesis